MLNASKIPTGGNTSKYEVLEAGSYPARLVRVVDIGKQNQRAYQGQAKPPVHMIQVTYELADEFAKGEDGEDDVENPRWVWEEFPFYSLKSERAKSTARYNALDPAHDFGGDWEKLVGSPCLVTLTREPGRKNPDQLYNNISAVSTMRAKQAETLPELVKEPVVFDMDDPNLDVFNSFSDNLKERIKGSLTFPGSVLDKALRSEGNTEPSGAAPFDTDELEDDGKDW